jgi:hypothetical protein
MWLAYDRSLFVGVQTMPAKVPAFGWPLRQIGRLRPVEGARDVELVRLIEFGAVIADPEGTSSVVFAATSKFASS